MPGHRPVGRFVSWTSWSLVVLAYLAGCSGRPDKLTTQLPGGRSIRDSPFLPGGSAHRLSVRRGPSSMRCAQGRFVEVGYEFPGMAEDTMDLVGVRLGTLGRDRSQELVRLKAKQERERPVMELTVGRPMEGGILALEALPASNLWVGGMRRTVEQADEIMRNCQGSPFGG
jgi:hypothetical protein